MPGSIFTKSEFSVCPICNGWGYVFGKENSSEASICGSCLGKGVWIEKGKARYYWAPAAGIVVAAEKTIKKIVKIIMSLAAILFIAAGYIEAVNFSLRSPNGFLALITERGYSPLFFWAGTAVLVYLIYRLKFKAHAEWGETLQNSQIFLSADDGKEEMKDFNVDRFLSSGAKENLRLASAAAKENKNAALVWHLLATLLNDAKISFIISRFEQDSGKIKQLIDKKVKELPASSVPGMEGKISPEIKKAILVSFRQSFIGGEKNIGRISILVSLALSFKDVAFFLGEAGINAQDLPTAIIWAQKNREYGFFTKLIRGSGKKRVEIKHRVMNRAWTARPTPMLDRFSRDITDYVVAGVVAPVVDRQREIGEVMRILERNSKNNVLLVGDVGSGRRTIINALAKLMVRDDALPKLRDKRLVALNAAQVVSGVKAGGELEQRLQIILREIQLAGNIILFIPDIHSLAESGSEHGFDVSEILTPVFTQSYFQVIGTTTFYDYHRVIEKRSDFADAFDIVKVDEVSSEVALEILSMEAAAIEDKEEVFFTFNALKKSIDLAKKYIYNKLLPAKAVDLLSEAAVMVRTKRGKNAIVGSEDIAKLLTEKTGVPVMDVSQMEAKKLMNMEEEIHKRMVDQNQAVKVVSEAIKRMRVGLKNEKKPMGVFLFLGPTGVGKTELAKTLAEVYFGSEKLMVRLDMSEFQDSRSIDRLIGSGDGQINGMLTEGVKKQPFSLVLLDEFEKSHPNVLDLFLQVFDDGRLTDGLGRVVDFTNTIIIATSNAGSKIIQERLREGKVLSDFQPEIEEHLLKYFKPELLNRFNAQVMFKTLSPEDIAQIAKLLVKKLAARLEEAQGIKLNISEHVIDKIVTLGYSSFYGARNLQRTITEKLENKIADKFLRGEIKRGQVYTIEDID